MKPPIAIKDPKRLVMHNDVRIDDYYWFRLSDNQKTAEVPDEQTRRVVEYLRAENEYCKFKLGHTSDLQEKIFNEIIGRIKQTDMSVPYFDNGYFYITRFEEGQEYAIHSRKKDNLDNEEEILIDENINAKSCEFYALGGKNISPDNTLMIFSEDTIGRRQYTIRIKNLVTGEIYDDVIHNTTGSAVWGNDNKTFFYTLKDEALRPNRVMRHVIGTQESSDEVVYQEDDDTYVAFVTISKSKKYILLGSWARLTQEYHYIDADHPGRDPKLFHGREKGMEYAIDHYGDYWYIKTNKDGAINYKIMRTPLEMTSSDFWEDVFEYDSGVFIEDMDVFENFFVISERREGNARIRIFHWSSGREHFIDFGEEAYMAYTSINKEFNTKLLRVGFTSMTTPNSIFDYDMEERSLTLLKQQEVVGAFDPNDYISERIMISARDGVIIPMSVVYRKGFKKDGNQPLLLYAYGSYGYSLDPYFSSARLSLLDRGFAFAIAHIRGGQEMGRQWYDGGKLLNKKNTFYDFIDCGKALIDLKFVARDKLFAMGGSAGGLLMGAVVNLNPELWKGVVAAVPFVDVVTTMLDESIPLTTGEFDEWGNPKFEEYYHYIKSYSPLDNIERKEYPNILVTSGFFDSQVQYWEPTKWVAKLREYNTGENMILLHTNMEAGHGGKSGRFRRFKETAMEYAFLIDLAYRD